MLKWISCAYVLIIVLLSLLPISGNDSLGYADKIAHFFIYAVMGVLAYFITGSFKTRVYLFFAIIALGVLLEFLQIVIPERDFSYLDIVANAAGTMFGFGLSWMYCVSRQTPSFGGCGSPQTTVPVKHRKESESLQNSSSG